VKKLIIVLIVFLYSGLSFAQTSYVSHRVEQGETAFSISKKYSITQEELFRLNPEARAGVREGSVLIIPRQLETAVNPDNGDVSFKTHNVKRRETIFGIASLYGTTVDEIKKYNRHLYANELKRGEDILIPIRSVTILQPYNQEVTQATSAGELPGKHLVQAGETKFAISRKYNITVEKLEALNPSIFNEDTLNLGQVLNVPAKPLATVTEPEVKDEENFSFYTVKPREGFYRLEVMFGLSEEEIIELNPHTKDGLKEGMVIKLPKTAASTVEKYETTAMPSRAINLEHSLSNFKPKNVVLFLPFQLDRIQMDSIRSNESQLAGNPTMRLAVDFYAGALLAIDFAKQRGISVNLHVFDSQEMEGGVQTLFNRRNIQNVDVVIGPLRQALVERTASELSSQNIPVISPLSNRQGRMYPNFIQSIPQSNNLENRMMSYLKANHKGQNIILITDNANAAKQQRLQELFPGLVVIKPRSGNFFRTEDISNRINRDGENWVILESSNATLVSSAVGILNSVRRSKHVRLFTLDKNDAFDFREVSNIHLSNLEFTYPSWNKIYNYNDQIAFVIAYRDKYGVLPNRFSVRGFDITYDALLRLASAESILDANDKIEGETAYVENKFRYQRNPAGGYVNTAVYILQYAKDLNVIELE
jgi:LysM repeat protein